MLASWEEIDRPKAAPPFAFAEILPAGRRRKRARNRVEGTTSVQFGLHLRLPSRAGQQN
jgi:hypothetical protein